MKMIRVHRVAVVLIVGLYFHPVKSQDGFGFLEKGYRTVTRIYDECQHQTMGLSLCLKKRAIAFLDRFRRLGSIPIAGGVELIGSGNSETRSISDEDLETLSGNGDGRDEAMNKVLFDKIASVFNGFNVQISLPKMTSGNLQRSLEVGRGKMKKMMGMMMMGAAMKMMALTPLVMGLLFLIAGKALIVSKIALLLSLLIGLKKLLSQKQGGVDPHGGWQQNAGGWDRSLHLQAPSGRPEVVKEANFAQSLAYKKQIRSS